MKNRAINALVEMGMPADIKGFQYIVDAMCLFEEKEWRNGKTTVLYYKIGEINGVKPQNVERSIRHAFEVTLTKGYLEAVKKYLSFECTTNGSQLHLLYIRLKQQEEEGEA
jgi:hypothetical protein